MIDLEDDNEVEHVRAMIGHMYHLPYDLSHRVETRPFMECLLFQIEMYNIGDKYDVPSLRTEVTKTVPNLLEVVSYDGARFAIAARAVYANHDGRADKSLERIVLDFCFDHMGRLHEDEDFGSMLEEIAPLSGALLRRVWSGFEEQPERFQCYCCEDFVKKGRDHVCDDGTIKGPLDSTNRRAKVLFLD